MPLSDSDIVQVNSGGFTGTTDSATLPAGTTAGNTLLLILGLGPGTLSTNPPTGFNTAPGDGPNPAFNKVHIYRKSNVAAGETSWPVVMTLSVPVVWTVLELSNIDLTAPVDVKVATFQQANGVSSQSTGTTPTSTSYDVLAVAAHSAYNASTATIPTWSGQTGGFTEITESGQAAASTAIGMAVSVQFAESLQAFSSTGTPSGTYNCGATIVVYTAAGARRQANVEVMSGFETGTAAGLATGNAGAAPFDSVTGTPTVVSTNPRTGSYCLELSSTAAAENVAWTSSGALGLYAPLSPQVLTTRVCVLFPSSLPGGDVDLFSVENAANNKGAWLRYRTASQKLGVTVVGTAAGTEQLSTVTVAADTWYAVDLRYDGKTGGSVTLTCDWQLDGVDQTQATAADTAAVGPAAVRLGWTAASTATVRYDDVVVSKVSGHYPLGDMRIYPLTVDPAATPTVTTAANFSTFTANGTLNATFNAATARDAVDDIPPTIGASADGFCQDTTAASDYVELPMQTRSGAANSEAIRGVRWYFCGWAASGTAATVGFRAWDGTTETTLFAAADPAFDNSTTTPAWVCRMHRATASAYSWTQAKLDALAARVGFSSDASPVIGVHAILAEVAMVGVAPRPLFGDLAMVAADPDSAGVLTVVVTAPEGGDTSLYYETNTTPTTVPVTGGTTVTQVINAPDEATTNYIAAYPAAEPDPTE